MATTPPTKVTNPPTQSSEKIGPTPTESEKEGGDAPGGKHSSGEHVEGSFDIEDEFDVFVTLLGDNGKGKSSKLISFSTLKLKAQESGTRVPFLPLSIFKKQIRGGHFCFKSNHKATFDASEMTLEDYEKRGQDAATKTASGQSLTIYWKEEDGTNADLGEVLKNLDLSNLDDKSKFASHLRETLSLSPRSEKNLQSTESELDVNDKLEMGKSKWSPPDLLREKEWDAVLEGNQLFYAYHIPVSVNEKLKNLKDSSKPDESTGLAENMEAPEIFSRALRPAFIVNPMSKLGSTKTLGSRPGNVNAGLFWSSTKTPAITTISRTLTTLDVWLSKGSFSKESFNIGASAGIKGVEIGGKFGFETEKSEISSTESAQKNERLTAVHEIPIVDINLDETTLQLSPDCLRDLERLRHHRRYSDLKKFFEEYGTIIFQNITLGGRLYTDRAADKQEGNSEDTRTSEFKTQVEASLGIPSKIMGTIGNTTVSGETQVKGVREVSISDNILWRGTGGDPTLTVDPSKWRESVLQYYNWRRIRQNNAIKVESLISRFPGYEDIPGLIDGILSSAILDPLALRIPTNDKMSLRIGQGINSSSGELTDGFANQVSGKSQPGKRIAGGFSWRVLRSERDIKSELSANLQGSLNTSVNLSAIPNYLYDLMIGETSMIIILKWSSDSQEYTAPDQEPINTNESKTGDFWLYSLTKKAWMVGIWQIQATETAKRLAFEKLSLDVYKFFSMSRQIEEGCDYLSQEIVRFKGSPVTQKFKLLASDGNKGCETSVNQPEWGPATHASDEIARQIRLKDINRLPFRATLRQIEPARWVPSEDCLLYRQEAIHSALFLNSRLAALGVKSVLKTSEPLKDNVKKGKMAALQDIVQKLRKTWGLLQSKPGANFLHDFDYIKAMLRSLDELEEKLANTAHEKHGDKQKDSDTHIRKDGQAEGDKSTKTKKANSGIR